MKASSLFESWPVAQLGPKPNESIIAKVITFNDLDQIKAAMMLRFGGATKAQLDRALQLLNAPEPEDVFEYTITIKKSDGTVVKEYLVAVNDDHAREEASYEYEGEVIAVERGKFLYKND